jgi:hypothetical protein
MSARFHLTAHFHHRVLHLLPHESDYHLDELARYLCYLERDPINPSLNESLSNLRTLRLDVNPASLNMLEGPVTLGPGSLPSVEELDVQWIHYPSPYIMRYLATCFPNLQTLRLGWIHTWCGLCNLAQPLERNSPENFVYHDSTGLPASASL